MKKTTRRQFLTTAVTGGAALAAMPFISSCSGRKSSPEDDMFRERYEKLGKNLEQPVFKKELFTTPVIIDTLELLEYNGSYLCRVRSKDGAEGIAVAHPVIESLYPIFFRFLHPFFIGQDARELDILVERAILYKLNFRLNGMTIGVPLATIEFAILDMMGNISGKSAAEMIGGMRNPEIGLYVATEYKELPIEEHFQKVKDEAAQFDTKALKIRVGFMCDEVRNIDYKGIPGKSEKLIPMVREHYGDDWALFADANSYYNVEEAIRIGRLLEEYKYGFFEEPVMYNNIEEIKQVADALTIPVANGEQDQDFYNFKWLLAKDGLDIVEPDTYYFGGLIRSMKLARMADSVGKTCLTHMSGWGVGYVYNAIFVSAIPNPVEYHEFKGFMTRTEFECPTSPLTLVDGKMKAPTGPGMGIVIDPEFVAKHKPVKL